MPETDFDLRKLLAPIGEEAFFGTYWEKQPLILSRAEPGYYAGLFSTADVDRVIAFTRPKFVDSDSFGGGGSGKKSFVQGWLADRQPQENASYPGIAELQRVYAEGKTVVVMTMQQRWLPIALLCRNLESVFRCPVHANMYLTPKGAQGFDAHFDTHEVLVLQLEGRKHWRLYEPTRHLPLVGERFDLPREKLGPAREVHLEAGDLLYVPRGHVHEAFTSECASLHLTVGVNVFRWADLLHEALAAVTREDERFRASLPPGVLGGEQLPPALKDQFRGLLDVLARDARFEGAVRSLGDQFFGSMQTLPGAHFAPPPNEEPIDLDTVLAKNPGAVCRIVQDGAWVAIEFPGGRIGGPLKIASALRFVAAADRFPVRALPDELGSESKLVLARRLVRERLLTVVGRRLEAEKNGAPC
jgi:ribosomal protein L16 Arg81 hydroxylase